MAGANIVDAQIFTTTDGLRARHHRGVARVRPATTTRRAAPPRIADTIEKALAGDAQAARGGGAARAAEGHGSKAFAIEPEVTINNQWSNRYTVIEVTGLDRPGLLYELTATLSKLNLNIASAHVATFGERVVDVFYVTDLLGAKIASPTRQAAIKRALLQLLSAETNGRRPQARAATLPARQRRRRIAESCSMPTFVCAAAFFAWFACAGASFALLTAS